MSTLPLSDADPQMQRALAELRELIRQHYPTATFQITHGDDPEGTYLLAIVDVADPDAVVDVFIERLLEWQIEAELPVYVIPLRRLAFAS